MIFRHLFGVTKVAGDIFFTCMFWFCFMLLAVLGLWELCERLFRGPPEEPAPRVQVGAEQTGEPDEWEKLTEEEKAELRRFFK